MAKAVINTYKAIVGGMTPSEIMEAQMCLEGKTIAEISALPYSNYVDIVVIK